MSSSPVDGGSSVGKRRSLFSRSPLSAIHDASNGASNASLQKPPPKQLRKRRTPPVFTQSPSHSPSPSVGDGIAEVPEEDGPKPAGRPTLSLRTSSARPSSIFGSLRSFKSVDELGEEPLTATSSYAGSEHWAEGQEPSGRFSKQVLCHGEVQTGSSIFRKRKEYVVLTETHIFKFKSQQKASEMFTQ